MRRKFLIIGTIIVLAISAIFFSIEREDVDFLGEAFTYIIKYYVEELNPQKVANDGIRGMVKKEGYGFLEGTPKEYSKRSKLFLPGFQGVYGHDSFVITKVFKGTDAQAKGIKEGDLLVEIEGFPVRLSTHQDVLWRLYGKKNSPVKLRFLRKFKIRDLEVKRDFPPRDFLWKGNRLVIYRLFPSTVDRIEATATGKKKVLLDLRFFLDGDWRAALSLNGLFPSDLSLTLKGEAGEKKISLRGEFPGKVVVITNGACQGACAMLIYALSHCGAEILSPSQPPSPCPLSPVKFEDNLFFLLPVVGIYHGEKEACEEKIKYTKVKEKDLLKEAQKRLET